VVFCNSVEVCRPFVGSCCLHLVPCIQLYEPCLHRANRYTLSLKWSKRNNWKHVMFIFANVLFRKSHPCVGLDRPWGLQEVGASRVFRQSAHEDGKGVSPKHRPPLSPREIPGTHFCYRMSRPHGHSAARRVRSMKNLKDPTGNRTRDVPAYSALSQPTAPLRTLMCHLKSNLVFIPGVMAYFVT
jgi:hypothetical protein